MWLVSVAALGDFPGSQLFLFPAFAESGVLGFEEESGGASRFGV
jgi:hypothetical protein